MTKHSNRRNLFVAVALASMSLLAACSSSLDDAATLSTDTSAATTATPDATFADASDTTIAVRVEGNRLVDADGSPLQMHGVNLSGFEYACAQGWGITDGPADQDVIDGMITWNINAVRVLMNEHCWLGRNGVDPEFSGANYQQAVLEWIDLLRSNNMRVIASLIWADTGDAIALDQAPMANRDHSIDFWASFAAEMASRDGVILDLYGEPHDIEWECWQSGCTLEDGYPAVGMQELLDVVRDAGATGPVIISGMEYANDLRGWLGWEVVDSVSPQQLVAGWHAYDFNRCVDPSCWEEEIAPVADVVPVIAVEFGGSTCDGSYVNELMPWMDDHNLSYLAWTWNPWDACAEGPDLVLDHYGEPNPYGEVIRDHYLELP